MNRSLEMERFSCTCRTAQIYDEVLRREYGLYSVTLLRTKAHLGLEVFPATQCRVAMDAMIDYGDHAALTLKACLGRDVVAYLKEFAP